MPRVDTVLCLFSLPPAARLGRPSAHLASLAHALAHDHPGRWTESWLGVQYPGGARWDLGVCELLYTFVIAGLFLLMDRRRRLPGTYLGLFLCLYGPFRFAVSFLHVDPVRYGGWTVDQYAGAAVAVAGLVSFHLRSRAGRSSATWKCK